MKGLPRSMSRGAPTRASIMKQTIAIRSVAMAVAGTSGIGWGTAVVGDFPEGNILFLGAVSYLQMSSVDADIIATFAGDYSIGTAPTADATLSGADVDLIPSTAVAAAVAGVSASVRGASAIAVTGTIYDNTDNSLEINLNVIIADASISGVADMVMNGLVVLSYVVLGDD